MLWTWRLPHGSRGSKTASRTGGWLQLRVIRSWGPPKVSFKEMNPVSNLNEHLTPTTSQSFGWEHTLPSGDETQSTGPNPPVPGLLTIATWVHTCVLCEVPSLRSSVCKNKRQGLYYFHQGLVALSQNWIERQLILTLYINSGTFLLEFSTYKT
jgi:hypothetical protein